MLAGRVPSIISSSSSITRRAFINNITPRIPMNQKQNYIHTNNPKKELIRQQTPPTSQSFSSLSSSSPATADLCDEHIPSPSRLQVVESNLLNSYGNRKRFHGRVYTVKCFESNPMVRKVLGEKGEGRVLVIDGGGSKRVAILGDMLANMAYENGWSGIVVNGCIRDSAIIRTIPIGVKALGTYPIKSLKDFMGERGVTVAFGGVEFKVGDWIYADEDGVIVSENELHIPTPESKL